MNKNTGFTLIEVLIAMIILAVGLLGLAGLQATSLRNNQSAYDRSVATQLAYDIADRMRANVAGKTTYTTILPSAAAQKVSCLSVTGCSVAEMAENDFYEWYHAVASALPDGVGSITADGNVFTITISWTENRGNPVTTRFQTGFQLL